MKEREEEEKEEGKEKRGRRREREEERSDFFNDTATTEIYTLSLHDALPIFSQKCNETGVQLTTAS